MGMCVLPGDRTPALPWFLILTEDVLIGGFRAEGREKHRSVSARRAVGSATLRCPGPAPINQRHRPGQARSGIHRDHRIGAELGSALGRTLEHSRTRPTSAQV